VTVTAILPTYERAAALRVTLPRFLTLRDVAEVVVVDDGSTDDTQAVLREIHDPRLRVIRHEQNRGSPAARNTGAAAVTTEWVVFLEDDCGFPDDYVSVLLRVAREQDADVVSAPWVNAPAESYDAEVARRRAHPAERFGLATHPGTFPPTTIETPFLCALALVRRDVVRTIRYDESLRGNAWREETDFYLRAVAAGHRCVLTPETASWQAGHWTGGQHPRVLAYEYWLLRNNWRFLRRHAAYLRAHGDVPGIAAAQARLAAHRGNVLAHRAGGAVKRRLRG
jgi:GT2 family glycosyltransferase